MDAKFKDVEVVFSRMKRRFRDGEISQREFIDSLKQLRIKDEEGRFWMIGPQSGKWYYFEGKDWVQSSPPSIGEKKAICIYCGYENDIESAVCAGCGGRVGEGKEEGKPGICPECGSEIDPETDVCPYCAAREMESAKDSDELAATPTPRGKIRGSPASSARSSLCPSSGSREAWGSLRESFSGFWREPRTSFPA